MDRTFFKLKEDCNQIIHLDSTNVDAYESDRSTLCIDIHECQKCHINKGLLYPRGKDLFDQSERI